MHHAGHRDCNHDEQQQRQQIVRLGDRERVERHGEVPVEQHAGTDSGSNGGPEAADERYPDDGQQIDEEVVGQGQLRPQRGQRHR